MTRNRFMGVHVLSLSSKDSNGKEYRMKRADGKAK
jgi:hypothetical protein